METSGELDVGKTESNPFAFDSPKVRKLATTPQSFFVSGMATGTCETQNGLMNVFIPSPRQLLGDGGGTEIV